MTVYPGGLSLRRIEAEQALTEPRLTPALPQALTVGRWQIDRTSREVSDGHLARRLSPRAMGVLLQLVEAQGIVVSRTDLLEAVWPDIHVSDESLTQAVAELRRVLGKDDRCRQYIETVPKAGYRLSMQVRLYAESLEDIPAIQDGYDGSKQRVAAHLAVTEARRLARNKGLLAVAEIDRLIEEAVATAPKTAHVQAEYALQMVCAAVHVGDRSARLALAAEAANDAVRLRPDQLPSRRSLGFVQGMTNDMDGALSSFSACLAIDPDDFETHYLAAKVCMGSGYLRQSITLAERACDLDPEDYRPAFNASRAALKLGDAERANELASLALRRIEAHLALGSNSMRFLSARSAASAILGRPTEDTETIMQRAQARPFLYDVVALAHLGATDLAVETFALLMDQGMTYSGWIEADPISDMLWQERDFRRAFERMEAA
ncbi:MAG: winged helix-turn-helix domain-containing protein [Pseudomonadota bacterium]